MAKKVKSEGILVEAAKTIGRTAGKVAVMVGAGHGEPAPKTAPRRGKFVKKDKHRLPRRQKKAKMRSAGAAGAQS